MKPFKETHELVDLLSSRGLNIDHADAAAFLHNFNYYRFTGYSRQFQKNPKANENEYLAGTKLSEIYSMIELDAELRRLLGAALTSVELSVRARFAHEAGRIFGDTAFYLNKANYLAITPDLDRFIANMHSDLQRSKSPTVAKFITNEGVLNRVPIWVAVEVFSFGVVAKMMMYLANDDPARQVAHSYSLAWEGFQSTIHSFSVLRNQCAHHGQIWHRKPSIHTPVLKKLRPREVKYDQNGIYPAIIMLRHYLKEIQPEWDWAADINALLESNPLLRDGVLAPFAK